MILNCCRWLPQKSVVCIFLLSLTHLRAYPHGVDTYNLLVKLFVEEYRTRYARTVAAGSQTWAAYPLDKRYASFEDVYYLYLLSLVDPQTTTFPPPRNLKDYERYICFIVMDTSDTSEKRPPPSISVDSFSIQWGNRKTQKAVRSIDGPIKRYPHLSDRRADSWLALFERSDFERSTGVNTPTVLRLHVRINDRDSITFIWNLPNECPFTDAKYESDIWTVAREKYETLPMPVHWQTGSKP